MKPVLYSSTETAFTSNGLGVLYDTVSAVVREERNGAYELTMEYPADGIHFSDISARSIILAKPNPTDDPQPFRVYRITKPIGGIVTIYAQHISYDLSGVAVSPFEASTLATVISAMHSNALPANQPFTLTTDMDAGTGMSIVAPASFRSLMGGTENSLLDIYGGEYYYNKYSVVLKANRGSNRGFTLRYGKNLTSFEQDESCAAVYSHIYPYWSDGTTTVEVVGKLVATTNPVLPSTRILPVDLTSEFDEAPTPANLLIAAQAYVAEAQLGVPDVNLTVSFEQLAENYTGSVAINLPRGRMRGDANGDGAITEDDETLISNVVNKISPSPVSGSEDFGAYDVTNDGKIASSDISMISNILDGRIGFGTRPEVTGTWTNIPSQSADDVQFYKDFNATGILQGASLYCSGFDGAYCEAIADNMIRVYVRSVPITNTTLTITWNFVRQPRVDLCDTVTIIFPKMGVSTTAKVITTEYDVLVERYTNLEIGDTKPSIADTIAYQQAAISSSANTVEMKQAIINATAWITGGKGGHVYFVKNADGEPEEIIIKTNDPVGSEQQRIWRWNIGGLGYSGNGGATYATAITADGHIVADTINLNTATIDGRLAASKIKVEDIEIGSGQISGRLEASQIKVEDIEIGSGQVTGTFSANKISGGTIDANTINVQHLNASNLSSGYVSSARISDSSNKLSELYVNRLVVGGSGGSDYLDMYARILWSSSGTTLNASTVSTGSGSSAQSATWAEIISVASSGSTAKFG